ncbi:hypothetical protein EW145_g7692 [Phellinidium pouzarii]|uniref:Reverse transcriptase Ty1/copia-type domain-containing protein n=1 Tax=Phellinidium pouzarii TaxID=167371 RepID=A0A4S4KFY2_9AGAM|nr:hypothetical protein EW145_g7692 [Phellinidium pouzarii]
MINVALGAEPIDFRDATTGEAADKWWAAMRDEWETLRKLKVFEPSALPQGRKAIGCKWVYKLKLNADGEISKYKARLVAQGFTQKYLIDYDAVHAPVARTPAFKLLAAMAAKLGMRPHQLDVKAAFLNGVLEEELYMRQPLGFAEPGKEHQVLKLNKSIYGLKQSGRVWNKTFDRELKSIGFTRLRSDPCIYFRYDKGGKSIIGLHVDDLAMFVDHDDQVTRLVSEMEGKDIELVHLGPLHFMLGIRFTWNAEMGTVTLDQQAFSKTILERFHMQSAKPASTPLMVGKALTKGDSPVTEEGKAEMQGVPYSALIGSFMYLVIWTRPDLAYSAMALSQFSSNPGIAHWTEAKHVLRYLLGTLDYGLTLGGKGSDLELRGYADADWGSNEHRHSITGYVFYLGIGAVSWQSKKQQTTALSSGEAEYMALSAATQEALWLRSVLSELGYAQATPTVIACDNQAAIALTSDSILHARVKHIDIRHHFIRDHVAAGHIVSEYVPTADQTADILTKGLPKPAHRTHSASLGLSRA